MIIGACGYATSGSSAVFDFLREFDGIQHLDIDSEFTYVYKVDGLQDLQYHLTQNYNKMATGDAAIKRFLDTLKYYRMPFMKWQVPNKEYIRLSKEYVNKLVQGSFYGLENYDHENTSFVHAFCTLFTRKFIVSFFDRKLHILYKLWPLRSLYICIEPDNFLEISKEYIRDMLKLMGFDLSKPILLNQPFEGNAPEHSFPFFDDPKALVVDRDPRDIFLSVENYGRDVCYHPKHNVKLFVEQYRQVRMHQNRENTERKLHVQFEDFVYNYDNVSKQIIEFLQLDEKDHVNPQKYFNPSRSINNTQLWLKYPNLLDEVKYIEATIPEYCFDYSKYGEIKHSGKSF